MSIPDFINQTYPIAGVKKYQTGVLSVIRKTSKTTLPVNQHEAGKRGRIEHLSMRSRTRLAYTAKTTSVKFASLLTLTYGQRFPNDGKEAKSDLNYILGRYRWLCKRASCNPSYLWVAEFQGRGAIHYHLLFALDVSRERRSRIASAWSKRVGRTEQDAQRIFRVHNHARQWEQIKKEDGAVRYVLKYALKPHQKEVPERFQNIGRFWGCSRDVASEKVPYECHEIDESELRNYLWGIDHSCKKQDIIPKVLFGAD